MDAFNNAKKPVSRPMIRLVYIALDERLPEGKYGGVSHDD